MPTKKLAIRVYVTDEEDDAITKKAEQTKLSKSEFCKNVCLGMPVVSKTDAKAVHELLRTRADLGRLGGLLKMWLTNDDEHVLNVQSLLEEIEQGQREVMAASKQLLKGIN